MSEGHLERLAAIYLNGPSHDTFKGFGQQLVCQARTSRDEGTVDAFSHVLEELVRQGWKEKDGLECYTKNNEEGTISYFHLDGLGAQIKVSYGKNQAGDRVYDAEVCKIIERDGKVYPAADGTFKARDKEDTRLRRSLVEHVGIDNLTEKLTYARAS